jgi:integrase
MPDIKADDFFSEYNKLFNQIDTKGPKKVGVSSLEWLVKRYMEVSAFKDLSEATRKQRSNILKGVVDKAGKVAYRDISRSSIINGREDRADTPAQARNYLDAMRGLFRWAVDAEHINVDPTQGVKNPKRKPGPGFEIWLDAEVAAYRERWPVGTRERVWLEVLIGVGARRGDAVIVGRQHVRDGMLSVETQKEGVWAFAPILPEMQEAIDAGPTGDLTFIVGKNGRNLTKETFGNMFRTACNAAGVKKSAHGLRKYAATRYAELGLSESELETIFGWVRGSAMAAHYSKTAERQRIAKGASEKIRNAKTPHPNSNAPHPRKTSTRTA